MKQRIYPMGQGDVYVDEIDIRRGHPISYPLEWFGAHDWSKPTLTVPKVTNLELIPGMKRKIINTIELAEQVDSELLKCFLYSIMKNVKCKLTVDWVSMGGPYRESWR